MKNRLLNKIFGIFKGEQMQNDYDPTTFKMKVEEIMKDEKDFSSLYDYNKIMKMSRREEEEYLCQLTIKYIETKQQILKEKLA